MEQNILPIELDVPCQLIRSKLQNDVCNMLTNDLHTSHQIQAEKLSRLPSLTGCKAFQAAKPCRLQSFPGCKAFMFLIRFVFQAWAMDSD
jgi:hypothetical protein